MHQGILGFLVAPHDGIPERWLMNNDGLILDYIQRCLIGRKDPLMHWPLLVHLEVAKLRIL